MDQLRCRVKAAAVANLTDARYFAALGVDYLGFQLEPGHEGSVTPTFVAALREWVEGPEVVGEFGGMSLDDIVRLSRELELHVVQVGPFGKTREVHEATGLDVLQALTLGGDMTPEVVQPILDLNASNVRGFVLDFARNGLTWARLQNEPTWMSWLETTCADYPVLIDVPAPADQVADILRHLDPVGLQLRGGDEEAVGVKSFDDLDDWFDVLRVEE